MTSTCPGRAYSPLYVKPHTRAHAGKISKLFPVWQIMTMQQLRVLNPRNPCSGSCHSKKNTKAVDETITLPTQTLQNSKTLCTGTQKFFYYPSSGETRKVKILDDIQWPCNYPFHVLSAHCVPNNVQTLPRLSLGSKLLESREFCVPRDRAKGLDFSGSFQTRIIFLFPEELL